MTILFKYERRLEHDGSSDSSDAFINVGAREYNTKWLITLLAIVACCWILIPVWTVDTVITIVATTFWIIIRKRVDYSTGDEFPDGD